MKTSRSQFMLFNVLIIVNKRIIVTLRVRLGPPHPVPRARGVRDAGVRAQLPGRVALRRADPLRGLLHADRRGHQVSWSYAYILTS